MQRQFTHLDAEGGITMVDVGAKPPTERVAIAEAVVELAPATMQLLRDRALPKGLDARVELGAWPVLPVIKRVVGAANLSSAEALKTFNCGIGMCVICPPESVDAAMEFFAQAGETPYRIGEIIAGPDAEAKGKVVYANADAEIFA